MSKSFRLSSSAHRRRWPILLLGRYAFLSLCASSMTTKSQPTARTSFCTALAKLMEVMTSLSLLNGSRFPLCRAWLWLAESRMRVGRLNFSSSSSAHCLRREAGQITRSFLRRSAQYWHRTRPASMVLPNPTSSARRAPLLSGDCRANRAASI